MIGCSNIYCNIISMIRTRLSTPKRIFHWPKSWPHQAEFIYIGTSINKDDLDKSMTKCQLGLKLEAVIYLLNFQWNVQPMIPLVIWSRMKKDEVIKELIKYKMWAAPPIGNGVCDTSPKGFFWRGGGVLATSVGILLVYEYAYWIFG